MYLYEIPHIFYAGIIHTHSLRTLTIHIYIYIYIYILSSTDRPVSFHQNSSVWLDRLDSLSWDQNPLDANPRFYHSATRKPAQAKEI